MELEITYETTNVEKEVTRAKFNWEVLLANIGGQLGLFTGFSVLTALEILELLYDLWAFLTVWVCSKMGRGRKKKSNTNVSNQLDLGPGNMTDNSN